MHNEHGGKRTWVYSKNKAERRNKMDNRLVQNSPMAIDKASDLFEKCDRFTKAKELIHAGMYPYFRVIESAQDPEVVIDGKKMIMVGSNNYLGLTNHPLVKEQAIEAIKKYGSGCAGSRFLDRK